MEGDASKERFGLIDAGEDEFVMVGFQGNMVSKLGERACTFIRLGSLLI